MPHPFFINQDIIPKMIISMSLSKCHKYPKKYIKGIRNSKKDELDEY